MGRGTRRPGDAADSCCRVGRRCRQPLPATGAMGQETARGDKASDADISGEWVLAGTIVSSRQVGEWEQVGPLG